MVINSIVNPSADISQGYDGTIVTLHDGTIVHGLLDSGEDPLIVRSMGGVKQLIPANRVAKHQRLPRSLMLDAEQLGLKAQDVADLVAYLRSL